MAGNARTANYTVITRLDDGKSREQGRGQMNGWVLGCGVMDVVVEMSSSCSSLMTSTGSTNTLDTCISEYKPVYPFGYAPKTSEGTGKTEENDERKDDDDRCHIPKREVGKGTLDLVGNSAFPGDCWWKLK
ncbi:hypothetical protein K435DRAFT_796594 [Dendrothele bispora CBS 962.96]|uniref:Uncharacterized protein n=1 Tax=Dendrothele bispora (strain CBS 962.96) TaxID=1314807 RepID=A0A4S8M4Z7_DENBC|nr:hypothetical protein K435DRAFT_796594 [Dendrothele bispora CBS 962.96]